MVSEVYIGLSDPETNVLLIWKMPPILSGSIGLALFSKKMPAV